LKTNGLFENTGSEAYKKLKTNDMALLNDAALVVRARRNTQIWPQNERKCRVSRETNRNTRALKRGLDSDK